MLRILSVTVLAAGLVCNSEGLTITDAGGGVADFQISGGTLTLTLSDTAAVTQNPQILSAIFFDLAGNPNLTPVSATASGSFLGNVPFTTGVGGEFRYQGGAGVLAYGASQGITSTGLGVFGSAPNFNGPNVSGQPVINGGDFSIVGPGSVWGNGHITDDPVIQGSVTFVLEGLGTLTEDDVHNITFNYGTSLPTQVPDVASTGGLLLCMVGLLPFARRIRR